ncbi:hypothetical protein [Streptomyces indicus]|uniref:Bifunctional DNA primase/polymerase, N-terminal n=1 Tax=Streptomyces indicus TaxID=417292 RepID=A0A1G9K1N5_9ACTN|nr:hypothetical protein [Streptomyces indicus]SDL43376.1 hypothetical protein SAMN05421806_14010 [Streptomyces indicus]
MTSEAALPRRTPGDRVRRAQLNDAASGFDGFAPISWIKRSGAIASEVLLAWQDGKLAEVPAGNAWDAVRLPPGTGSAAFQQLRASGSPLGPVLKTPDAFVFLVPVGAASDWNLPGVSVLGRGETLRVPHPVMTGPHERDGCSWHHALRDDDALTDADDLYGAYIGAASFMDGTGALG